MALLLDDIRKEFATFLVEKSGERFSMDKALAHVVELAYRQGVDDSLKSQAVGFNGEGE